MINYNYLFDLTPISYQEQLICSDYLEDRNEEILANCLRFNYRTIDLYKKYDIFELFRYFSDLEYHNNNIKIYYNQILIQYSINKNYFLEIDYYANGSGLGNNTGFGYGAEYSTNYSMYGHAGQGAEPPIGLNFGLNW